MKKNGLAALGCAILLALTLSACGGVSDGPVPAPTPGTPAQAPAAATPDKRVYAHGETVKITVKNTSGATVSLPDPNAGLKLYTQGTGGQPGSLIDLGLFSAAVIVDLKAGQTHDVAFPAPGQAGKYVAVLSFASPEGFAISVPIEVK